MASPERYPSVLRNPLIAETFHRTGAVEVWGRGTNRVIEECRRYGVEVPTFEEQGGTVVVTFRAPIALGPGMTPQVTPQVLAVLEEARKAGSRNALMEAAGLRDREHFRSAYLEPLVEARWLEMTIPDKPRSLVKMDRVPHHLLTLWNPSHAADATPAVIEQPMWSTRLLTRPLPALSATPPGLAGSLGVPEEA